MSQSRSQATSSQFVNTQVANKILKHCSKKSDAYKDEDEEERKVLARKADEVVNYILFNNLSVNKPVVRRADINKFILGDHSRSYKDVMVMVKRRLSDVFGLCLVDIDGSDTGEKYGLKCKYEYDPLSSKLNSECKPTLSSYESSNEIDHELNEQFKYSMIMISLALILMNENEIEANLFWDSLKRLDINPEEKKHKYLGDVKKYFTSDLTKEGYLEVEKISSLDASTEKFKAGYRSKLEISKSKILEFVCIVYGGLDVCKPEEWSIQYNEAKKEDMENGEEEMDQGNGQVREEEDQDDDDEDEEEEQQQQRPTQATQKRTQSQRRR